MASNEDETRQQLLRRRMDGQADSAAGYRTPSGHAQAVPGDDRSPWFRNPPFPGRIEKLRDFAVLSRNGAAYDFTPDVDVAKSRVINVFFTWSTVVVGGAFTLSVVPEYRPRFSDAEEVSLQPGAWPMVAINPTISVQTLSAPFAAGFASRVVAAAEFRTNALTGPFAYRFAMPFEVTSSDRVRFGLTQLDDSGDSRLETWWQSAT